MFFHPVDSKRNVCSAAVQVMLRLSWSQKCNISIQVRWNDVAKRADPQPHTAPLTRSHSLNPPPLTIIALLPSRGLCMLEGLCPHMVCNCDHCDPPIQRRRCRRRRRHGRCDRPPRWPPWGCVAGCPPSCSPFTVGLPSRVCIVPIGRRFRSIAIHSSGYQSLFSYYFA